MKRWGLGSDFFHEEASGIHQTAQMAGNEPLAASRSFLFIGIGWGSTPSDIRPRAFPLGLLAPRCLGAVLLLALPACWLVLGHRFCLGRRRNLLPSVGLLLADVIQLTRCFPCFVITDCSVTFCLCLRRLALANPFSLFQLGDSGVAFASEFGDFFSAALVRYRTP